MAITYTWSIPNNGLLTEDIDGKPDVVTRVSYSITATDEVNTIGSNGVVKITLNDNTPFTSFSSLTQEQVIAWVQAALGDNKVNELKNSLDKKLDRLTNPPVAPTRKANPWV